MGRLYDAFVEVGPRFAGMGDVKKQGDKAGKEYGKALAEAAEKAAKANVRRLGEVLAKARSAEADAAGKVRVAEAKLLEVQKEGNAKASALAAAEEAVAAAHRKAAAASDTSKSAAEALGKAQKRVAEIAESAGKSSGNRFTGAFKGALSKIGGEKEGREVATRFGVGLNGAIGSVVSRSAGVFVAGFAAVQGLRVFGGFIQDARESAKISRITENAIRATGGAAKITADQVGDLATAISNKTGIDDEQVQTAANMLLTFKQIRNETGKGNDIFNQATQAAADLSVQFGGIDGASKQLGKALNDPIKGTTALAKAGVTFTDQQKEQIKTLVKSGDVLGAQKIILKEIQGQVGGAAAAAADPLQKLQVVAGNLAEEVGGFLLPAANKFAGFATGTLIPGIKGLFSAFQGEGITSDGFVGFMERVGVASRTVFDYFKAEVLPRLKDFGGFVTGTVAPALGKLIGRLTTELGPTVKDVFGFFKTDVIPRLKDFAGFLNDKVVPPVKEFADKVLLSKDFLVPFAGIILGVVAALKAWAAIQAIVNIVLSANPIGLVILAVAALAGGIIYAYKHSEKFREIVQGAFQGIQKAAQIFAPLVKAAIDIVIGVFNLWWNYYAKPILKGFWEGLKAAWARAQDFARIVGAAFNAIKEPARVAIKFVIDRFLGFVENILTGASKAFGWVPELGGKLKSAAGEFRKFRDSVNNALDGINDEPVDIKVGLAYTQALGQKTKQMKFATGGGVFGAGTATSDSIPALLSNGEHVITAKEVRGAGGHGALEQMRSTWAKGYAHGGVVLRSLLPGRDRIGQMASVASSSVDAAGSRVAQAIAAQLVKLQVNPGLKSVLSFVSSQVGKPYVWGGVGPGGYDCSGLVSAAINVALGRDPYRRLGATGSMPWSMFASGPGAFEVGWFQGNPGHTAATVNGVNIESRGGRGVVMGSSARGARNRLFTNRAHVRGFANGGVVGDLPYDLLNPRGKAFAGKGVLKELGIGVYDKGGRWPSGTLGLNMSGKTETVTNGEDPVRLHPRDIEALADAVARRPLLLDGRSVGTALAQTALNGGY